MNIGRLGKTAFLAGVLILAAAMATAPSVQHHPFSEIFPPDQDLNFGEYDAFNMTELDLADGLIFTGNVIRNSGNSLDVIRFLDTGSIEVPSGNIDMKGNNITSSDGEVCIGEHC